MSKEQITYDITSDQPDGLVIYTDGGSRPNGKYMGWGIHGYSFKDLAPKKGTGNPGYYPSAFGYVPKSEKKDSTDKVEITPVNYIDGYGSSLAWGTNNLAEILAAKMATQKAIELGVKKLLIRTDSEYLINGSNYAAPHWIRNNWIKADGKPVPNAKDWSLLLANYEVLKTAGCEIKLDWVKGHSDFLGNTLADRLATVGVMGSITGGDKEQIDIVKPDGYWKSTVEKHPFFCFKSLYFTTLAENQHPGEYFIGEQDKDIEFLGKRKSDGAYGVFYLKEPEPIVDLVRTFQTKLTGSFDNIVILRLDHLFKQHVYTAIEKYGSNAVVRRFDGRIDLTTTDKEPLTKELVPPRLAQRSIDAMAELKNVLNSFKTGTYDKDKFNIVDVTDVFYENRETEKKKETIVTTHLKETINSTFSSFNVETTIKDKVYKMIITLGIDTPSRNTLKSLEDPTTKISVVWWYESDKVIRYATVIEYKEDYGIWAGYYSNMLFLD